MSTLEKLQRLDEMAAQAVELLTAYVLDDAITTWGEKALTSIEIYNDDYVSMRSSSLSNCKKLRRLVGNAEDIAIHLDGYVDDKTNPQAIAMPAAKLVGEINELCATIWRPSRQRRLNSEY